MRAPRLAIVTVSLLVLVAGCSALRSKEAVPPPDAAKILLRYQMSAADAAAEEPILFRVRASDTAAGPFAPLFEEPVAIRPARAGTVVTVATDTGVRMGQTRYYFLEKRLPDSEWVKAAGVVEARAVLPLQPEDRALYREQAAESARR